MGQIHLTIGTNTFQILNKYSLRSNVRHLQLTSSHCNEHSDLAGPLPHRKECHSERETKSSIYSLFVFTTQLSITHQSQALFENREELTKCSVVCPISPSDYFHNNRFTQIQMQSFAQIQIQSCAKK